MSIYDPIAIALGIEPNKNFFNLKFDDSDLIPNDCKNSQTYNLEANRINASKGGIAKAAKKYPAWNKGKVGLKRSDQSIEKQKLSITGRKKGPYKNYNHSASSVQVEVAGVVYPSISAACRHTGMSPNRIKRLQRTQPPFPVQPTSSGDSVHTTQTGA